ncbi:hypothetical protein [Gloeothece verrucosa]|uniref:Uncharacterized protein n=1 Tax=Gloeothece verrucosa (strain PCC 7822) TaxID=497965 RepID=E0U8T6_GLOV7|nr:hypothetical protein [Gloeothece verrucosa]ADN14950.1 hypothetical protein Cyan7822_2993 [Gloeothece verrucosa PCC 7822]
MSGSLTRLNINLLAQEGQDLTVDSTVFIPDDNFSDIWNNLFNCSVLGLGGFLERFRFAIDFGYDRDIFYFGSL